MVVRPNAVVLASVLLTVGGIALGCATNMDSSSSLRRRSNTAASDPEATDPTKNVDVPAGAGLSCDVAQLLETKCLACHGETPTPAAQSSLVTMADLLAPSKSDGSKNEATVSLERMKDSASPMPPTSYQSPVTAAEIAAFEAWIKGDYQGSCGETSTSTNQPPANLTCTSCHGDATRAAVTGADPQLMAAPPKNTKGDASATAKGVGAHQAHLTKGSMSNLVACNECHVVPTSTSHSNGVVGLTFGTLAKTGNKTPAWNGTACSASYCHGNFTGGNTAAAPAWTAGAMTCTSCHDAPPATGDHRRGAHNFACSKCHGNGYTSTTVNKATHINGVKNVGGAGSNINNFNAATGSCTPTCHGTKTW